MSDIPNLRKILNSLETSVQNVTDLNVEVNVVDILFVYQKGTFVKLVNNLFVREM